MDIIQSTKEYEAWAFGQIAVVRPDLEHKHQQMRLAAFPFMRATFYRWSQLWREACPELAAAPSLLAVGDLHVENFGTWRDAEGRLIWGINDFDEAARMPYAIDLVRLATSAILARVANSLAISPVDACAVILGGYDTAIKTSGEAFVLEEKHPMLRQLAMGAERDPARFWAKANAWSTHKSVPTPVRKMLAAECPEGAAPLRIVHRVAGLGSLGRQRFIGLAESDGGMVAREAKAMLPSAYRWAAGKKPGKLRYDEIIARSVRCPDPFARTRNGWLIRRLGPHCSRIELADIPLQRDERHILECMGKETANIHLGSPDAVPAIRADLRRRKPGWLLAAAETMAEATMRDWKRWKVGR